MKYTILNIVAHLVLYVLFSVAHSYSTAGNTLAVIAIGIGFTLVNLKRISLNKYVQSNNGFPWFSLVAILSLLGVAFYSLQQENLLVYLQLIHLFFYVLLMNVINVLYHFINKWL